MPIRVFKMATHGNIKRVVLGEPIGTIVEGESSPPSRSGRP